jgi:DNA-binding PadR family transcriptional regulator
MAKKQRSNPLALAVLVFLFERPMHPYEIATTLRERRKEDSIKIRFGSLYTVIDRLQADGLITPRETSREGRRPERTVYQLTPTGKAEMNDWLGALIGEPVKEYTQFEAGLCLLAALPPGAAIELLTQRAQRIEKESQQLRAGLDRVLVAGLPPLFVIEAEYRLSRMNAERQFVLRLLRRIDEEGWATSPVWNYLHGPRPRTRRPKKATAPKIRKRKP